MKNFHSLGLEKALISSLEKMKYSQPTPIQAQAIPLALDGKDIIGSAQTGTGKTAAFSIPLVQHVLQDKQANGIVIAPTRELAHQVMDVILQLVPKKMRHKVALLIGGEPIKKQLFQLKKRPCILVGTPGRINDHLQRKTISLKHTNFLVLDETDRMLDMGFSEQIDTIVQTLPKERQTLLFSATFPKHIQKLAQKYLSEPTMVTIKRKNNVAENIEQNVMHVKKHVKYETLLSELDNRTGSVIVFVKTKVYADKIAKDLRSEKHRAHAIHGDLRHNKRKRVIQDFRNQKYRIMVATDIAARGLDIPHIEHVINYDLPQCPEDYIHRIGRTARAGKSGSALCFVTPAEKRKWKSIDKLMKENVS